MKKDRIKTKVQFLVHDENITSPGESGDLFAYFPDEIFSDETIKSEYQHHFTKLRVSYSHAGQHGACHPDYIHECRPATPEEYADLKAELESIGYNLKIVQP